MNYEEWKLQLDERASSPAGRERLDKQAAQNKQNRQNKRNRAIVPTNKNAEQDRLKTIQKSRESARLMRGMKGPGGSTGSHFSEPKAAQKVTDAVRNNPTKTSNNKEKQKQTKGEKSYNRVMKRIRRNKRMDKIADLKDRKAASQTPGFRSTLASKLGGDHVAGLGSGKANDAENIRKRRAARAQMGQNVGNFLKKAPGRALSVFNQKTNTSSAGTSQSQNLSGPKRGVYNG